MIKNIKFDGSLTEFSKKEDEFAFDGKDFYEVWLSEDLFTIGAHIHCLCLL